MNKERELSIKDLIPIENGFEIHKPKVVSVREVDEGDKTYVDLYIVAESMETDEKALLRIRIGGYSFSHTFIKRNLTTDDLKEMEEWT